MRYDPYELPQGIVARFVDVETAKQIREALLYDVFPHTDRYTYAIPDERKPKIQVLTPNIATDKYKLSVAILVF